MEGTTQLEILEKYRAYFSSFYSLEFTFLFFPFSFALATFCFD